MLKIVFMGTPDFAKESLKAIYEKGHNILGVVTNPDKPKGRGMKLVASPVKEYALEKKLPIFQPTKVRHNEEFIEEIQKLKPDVICVVAYGKILPKELLDIPKLGCINVHGSLLPQYRGAAPIQWAVLNGDNVTGITTMYMDVGMDTGDMILKREVTIGEEETTGELWDRLSAIGANLLVETLDKIESGEAPRVPQQGPYTMAPMLSKEMAQIHWKEQNTKTIHDLIRGLNPIMGAYTFLDGKKLKIWQSKKITLEALMQKFPSLERQQDRFKMVQPGTVLFSNPKEGFYVKTMDGALKIEEIQGENAKKMKAEDFLRGNPIAAGTLLES